MTLRSLSSVGIISSAFVALEGSSPGNFIFPIVAHCLITFIFSPAIVTNKGSLSVPTTLFIILEFFRGCIVPLLVETVGQDNPPYRLLGTFDSGARILWIGFGCYAIVLFTLWIVRSIPIKRREYSSFLKKSKTFYPSNKGIHLLVFLGTVGLILRFPSPQTLISFLLYTAGAPYMLEPSLGSIAGLLASLLRPLLPLGLAILILKRGSEGRSGGILWLALALSTYLTLGSYSLNRAAVILPISALLIAIVFTGAARISRLKIAVIVATMTFGFLWVGELRRNQLVAKGMIEVSSEEPWYVSMVQTFMIYGQSPLQLAPALSPSAVGKWGLESFINSLVSPIPGIGDTIRQNTGAAIYNSVIYGNTITKDQILPSWLEAYLSFGLLGIMFMSAVLVTLILLIERGVDRAATLLEAYALCMASLVIAQLSISSFTAIFQTLLYFVLAPSLIALALRKSPYNLPKINPRSRSNIDGSSRSGVRGGF